MTFTDKTRMQVLGDKLRVKCRSLFPRRSRYTFPHPTEPPHTSQAR